MVASNKFLFDTNFSAPGEPEQERPVEETPTEPEVVEPTYGEEQLLQAREEGFAAGKEEGHKEALASLQQRILDTLDVVGAAVKDLYAHQREANDQVMRDAVVIALGISRKLFPDLNERNALGEVGRMVEMTVQRIVEEPRVVIRVHSDLRDSLDEHLDRLSKAIGYEGKLIVSPDDSIAMGDCRMEWSSGAAVRDTQALWQIIEEVLERNFGANGAEFPGGEGSAAGEAAIPADAEAASAPSPQPSEPPAAMPEAAPEPAPAASTEPEVGSDSSAGAAGGPEPAAAAVAPETQNA